MILRCVACALICSTTFGATYEVSPGDDVQTVIFALQPGDVLQLHGGTYSARYKFHGVAGTEARPVTIENYPGEAPVISNPYWDKNVTEVADTHWLIIRGLELTGGGGDGLKAVSQSTNSHITIENCVIHDVGGVGIDTKGIEDYWVIRHNEIYNTNGHGEAMYLGTISSETYRFSNGLIEFNYIHDTGGSQGDGIEIKWGGYGNIIRHNVICRCLQPGIVVQQGHPDHPNIIEGNVLWNCWDNAIQVYRNVIVRNNITWNNGWSGIGVQTSWDQPQNVVIVNNTVYDEYHGIFIAQGDVLVANNAVYSTESWQEAFHIEYPALTNATFVNNVYKGNLYEVSSPGIEGNDPAVDMVDPENQDFWPTASSALLEAAGPTHAPAEDFNAMPRPEGSLPDAGAYERSGNANPGWTVQEGFKSLPSPTPDTVPPLMTATHAAVTGTARDASGIQGGEVTVDGVSVPLSGGVFASGWLSAGSGDTLTVRAEDTCGNERVVSLVFEIH